MGSVAVPERLLTSARALGPAGARWLEDLPDMLADLAADWSLAYGRSLDGGNAAYVLEAVTADGRPVVAKLALPAGVAVAIYVSEFAAEAIGRVIRLALDVLNGVPSIVIGIFVFVLLVSGSGQSEAAHALCLNIPAGRREHYLAPRVGHYGIFSGRRWREMIYPQIREFVRRHA